MRAAASKDRSAYLVTLIRRRWRCTSQIHTVSLQNPYCICLAAWENSVDCSNCIQLFRTQPRILLIKLQTPGSYRRAVWFDVLQCQKLRLRLVRRGTDLEVLDIGLPLEQGTHSLATRLSGREIQDHSMYRRCAAPPRPMLAPPRCHGPPVLAISYEIAARG